MVVRGVDCLLGLWAESNPDRYPRVHTLLITPTLSDRRTFRFLRIVVKVPRIRLGLINSKRKFSKVIHPCVCACVRPIEHVGNCVCTTSPIKYRVLHLDTVEELHQWTLLAIPFVIIGSNLRNRSVSSLEFNLSSSLGMANNTAPVS